MDNEKAAYYVLIKGRVQGVAFRWYTMKKAVDLDLYGYVRNMPGGEVEAEFEGDRKNVFLMLEWCKTGPPSAHVEDTEIIEKKYSNKFHKFSIEY
ncbi:MAG: acylphosphatase [Thermodesulfobacteriota bacterium]